MLVLSDLIHDPTLLINIQKREFHNWKFNLLNLYPCNYFINLFYNFIQYILSSLWYCMSYWLLFYPQYFIFTKSLKFLLIYKMWYNQLFLKDLLYFKFNPQVSSGLLFPSKGPISPFFPSFVVVFVSSSFGILREFLVIHFLLVDLVSQRKLLLILHKRSTLSTRSNNRSSIWIRVG